VNIQDVIREMDEFIADVESERDGNAGPLRKWMSALEAAMQCPHIVTSGEGTSYCDLAESSLKKEVEHSALLVAEIERLTEELAATRDATGFQLAEQAREIERLNKTLEWAMQYLRRILAEEDK
jgi:hypothetical protein